MFFNLSFIPLRNIKGETTRYLKQPRCENAKNSHLFSAVPKIHIMACSKWYLAFAFVERFSLLFFTDKTSSLCMFFFLIKWMINMFRWNFILRHLRHCHSKINLLTKFYPRLLFIDLSLRKENSRSHLVSVPFSRGNCLL